MTKNIWILLRCKKFQLKKKVVKIASQLLFNKKTLETVEKDYSKLTLPPISKQYVEEFAKIWTKFLPMSELAIRGFISYTMRDFQLQTHIEAPAILQLPKQEMMKYSDMMLNIMIEKISKALVHKEQKEQLAQAIREVGTKLAQI